MSGTAARVARWARVAAASAWAAAALIGLAGCGVGGALIPSGSASGGPGDGGGTDVEASSLVVGDCLNAVDGDLLAGVDAVPCAAEHDWEVYDAFTVPPVTTGTGFPGTAALVAAAEQECAARFGPFLGLAASTASSLGYTYVLPDQDGTGSEGTAEGYVVRCLIGDMDGPVSGSLAGTLADPQAAPAR